jgi:hypothetical protein
MSGSTEDTGTREAWLLAHLCAALGAFLVAAATFERQSRRMALLSHINSADHFAN